MRGIQGPLRIVGRYVLLVIIMGAFFGVALVTHRETGSGKWISYERYLDEVRFRHARIRWVMGLMRIYYHLSGLRKMGKSNSRRGTSDFRYEMF